MFLPQRSAWIEILGRQGYEAGRRRGRQTQADIQFLAVVERDESALALVALAPQRLAVPLPKLDEERLDVLAVPSVLAAKSGQEQKFSNRPGPRIATR